MKKLGFIKFWIPAFAGMTLPFAGMTLLLILQPLYAGPASEFEREIQELTEAIEGIQVRAVGQKVLITGHILTAEDQKILERIEKLYKNVINLASPLPSATRKPSNFMVQMHVKFLEVAKEDLQKIGIQFPENIKAQIISPHFLKTDLHAFLHAIEIKGWAKTIAEPTLVCNSGQKAKFLAGGEMPIRVTSKYQSSVQWKPYGVTLEIEPQIHSHTDLTTSLLVELSDLNEAKALEGIPSLTTRRLNTSVRVSQGQTIILSGMKQKQNTTQTDGLPFLSQLPLLGHLFSTHSQVQKEVELMIFLTPTISLSGGSDEDT